MEMKINVFINSYDDKVRNLCQHLILLLPSFCQISPEIRASWGKVLCVIRLRLVFSFQVTHNFIHTPLVWFQIHYDYSVLLECVITTVIVSFPLSPSSKQAPCAVMPGKMKSGVFWIWRKHGD